MSRAGARGSPSTVRVRPRHPAATMPVMCPVMHYDDAVASLFQVPLDQFVTERKRLAGELKAGGDKDGAARLAKLARPPTSAWAVNQLWWHARASFEALFETARRLRDGTLDAAAAHREALAKLRVQAMNILTDAGHGTTEATLRRVTLTLSALAAAGGWDPDLPGALSADRDPPGFEALGAGNVIALPVTPAAAPAPTPAAKPLAPALPETGEAPGTEPDDGAAQERRLAAEARARELAAAAARAEAAAALRRAEAERAKVAAERHRLEAALRTAQGDVAQREREVTRLERDLAAARGMVEQARAVAEGLAERLAQLDN